MSDKIIDILKDSIEAGYTPEDIKEAVITTLSDYFENEAALNKYATTAEILSAYEFAIRYHHDSLFSTGLTEVINCYNEALKINPIETFKIILSTINEFSQKENLMWTVRQHTPSNVSTDQYEAVITYMKHIGDNLEIGTKHIVSEIYALTRLINGKAVDYKAIQTYEFGVVIKNILDQRKFESILRTIPIPIKLSDWRNIAYHHTYSVELGEIVCTYGKQNENFKITFEELQGYVYQVVRASNIFNIARCIFVFDNLDTISAFHLSDEKQIDFREPILMNQLKISLISQGFLLMKCEETDTTICIVLNDLENDGTLNKSETKKREIHSSQFLYNLWCAIQKTFLKITYCDKHGNKQFISSVSGSVCKTVSDGKEDISYLAKHVKFKNLKLLSKIEESV